MNGDVDPAFLRGITQSRFSRRKRCIFAAASVIARRRGPAAVDARARPVT
jgi:hypothetical protein